MAKDATSVLGANIKLEGQEAKDQLVRTCLWIVLPLVVVLAAIVVGIGLGGRKPKPTDETWKAVGRLEAVKESVKKAIDDNAQRSQDRRDEIDAARAIKDEQERLDALNAILNKGLR